MRNSIEKIYRETNQCADGVARLRTKQNYENDNIMIYNVCPQQLNSISLVDLIVRVIIDLLESGFFICAWA